MVEDPLDQASEPKQFLETHRIPLILVGLGVVLLLIGGRMLFIKTEAGVEFIEEASSAGAFASEIKVDIAGAVESPGVYTLNDDNRIHDLFVAAGGLAENADRQWVAKYINLAAKLSDGSKVYIPAVGEIDGGLSESIKPGTLGINTVNASNSIININNASATELDSLPGVGQVTADKIIANRPYVKVEEVLEKKAVNKNTFEKIKDRIAVY